MKRFLSLILIAVIVVLVIITVILISSANLFSYSRMHIISINAAIQSRQNLRLSMSDIFYRPKIFRIL